ncbi:cardiolipin synthase [Lutispora thermophila]|uniref:Cardiolipin synthase n=1 Tax=Lutispora thermophila DSM 19022 TaxID=1122184 RepID=A0A1M6B4F1_9FIRM|nr:cardiolipin synthase [Lutispora thermophila]SHI43576.1 cardiolipin synthase [Lutispora thermophila DSM 19022]
MKYIVKFLFHRACFLVLAILVQLFVFIGVIVKFYDYFAYFYAASLIISLVVILFILNSKSNPVYKIAWIIPILLFPIFGGLFYIFIGNNKLSKRARQRMKSISDKTREALKPKQQILDEMKLSNEIAANQSRYIQDYAYYPPYCNTFTEYLSIGEIKFERLKEELKKAKKFIFLEYFIIEEGIMWNSILDILKEKVKEGVDVRVIYDDAGCILKLPYGYDKKLESLGIKCCIFNPLVPLLSTRFNTRDHRKIAIIDGHTGFTGGINLADEYINEYERFGHWKDTAIMVKGEAVWSMTVMFLSMWDYLKGIDEDFEKFKPDIASCQKGCRDGYVQPYADSPLDDETVGEVVYLNLINKARKYVYITTPYLIIDNEMITALTSAAKGGVDVRIITPHCGDKWYVHEVTRSYYKILVEGGVKIYEYTPGFIHSKTFVVDDEYGVVGTINMDYRSLFLHFECGVWMYNCSSVGDIKEDFIKTLEMCQEITLKDLKQVKWHKTLIRMILRIFAPLM